MTMMNVCVLEVEGELWCGIVHVSSAVKFAAAARNNTSTLDDLLNTMRRTRYPWNFSYFVAGKRKTRKIDKEYFSFYPTAGIPTNYATIADIETAAPEGAVFVDLKNKALFHLDLHSPDGPPFPHELVVHRHMGDPEVDRIKEECIQEAMSRGVSERDADWDCISKAYEVRKKPARGFKTFDIVLDHIGSDGYNETDEQAIRDFIRKIQDCNHPSGEFYRSLTECM